MGDLLPFAERETDRIRLLIVDDHELIRMGLETLLEADSDLEVVGQCGDAASAIELALKLRPDVVVLDLHLPEASDGISVCQELRAHLPGTSVLVHTSYSEHEEVVAVMNAGAAGYMLKSTDIERLLEAIRSVAAGSKVLDPALVDQLVRLVHHADSPKTVPAGRLNPQEERIFALLAAGKTNREIAAELRMNKYTVKASVSRILLKLGITRRSQVVTYLRQSATLRS